MAKWWCAEVERKLADLLDLLDRASPGLVRWPTGKRRWKAPEDLAGKLGEMKLLVNHR